MLTSISWWKRGWGGEGRSREAEEGLVAVVHAVVAGEMEVLRKVEFGTLGGRDLLFAQWCTLPFSIAHKLCDLGKLLHLSVS